jgi:hypothetical protein
MGAFEPGLDLHEWETRWQELLDAFAESPEDTLPEVARFVEALLVERGYQLDEPVTVEGEDPDIARAFLAARQLARLVEAGRGHAEDVQTAFESLRDIHDYVVTDRAPP